MREQDISARFRRTPIAAAFVVAFVTACGGGGSGGGGGGTSEDSDLSEEQKEAVATTTATQVAGVASGARTATQSADEVDGDTEVDDFTGGTTSGVTSPQSMGQRVLTFAESGALAHSVGDECDSGNISTSEFTDSNGFQVFELNASPRCVISVHENEPDAPEVRIDLSIGGIQRIRSNNAGTVILESEDFDVSLDEFFMSEYNDPGSDFTSPQIGPIEAGFSSDGGYEASYSTAPASFSMEAASWDLGFNLGCDGKGFEAGFELTNFSVESNEVQSTTPIWEHEINGSVAWFMDADSLSTTIDEEVSYTTSSPIRVEGFGDPVSGVMTVEVGGDEFVIEFQPNGSVNVNGTTYTQAELQQMHEEQLGADLEQAVLGDCVS